MQIEIDQNENPLQTELDSINKRLSEIYRQEGVLASERGALMVKYINSPDKRDDIQRQIDTIDSKTSLLVEERNQLEARKAELESQLQTP